MPSSRPTSSRLSPTARLAAIAGVAALTAATLGAATSAPSAGAAGQPSFVRLGRAALVPNGARAVGPLAASRVMQLGVSLRPRNPGALERFATEVSTPGSSIYGEHVRPAEFARRFGPSSSAIAAVRSAFSHEGFRLGQLSANHLLLQVSAPVDTVDSALGTELSSYALPDGKSGWAASAAPRLPAAIAPDVSAVLGLDQLVAIHPMIEHRRGPERSSNPRSSGPVAEGAAAACAAATKGADAWGGWTDDVMAKAYGLDALYKSGDLGKGETIAIFELEPYVRSDIRTFDECYFGKDHTNHIRNVALDGGSGTGPGEGEAVLDIENISALAPDARMVVYDGPQNDFGNIYASTDEYETIVSQDRANIISTSWGLCESALNSYAPGTLETESYLFEEAAAQGESVFAAAGDDGSDDCSFDNPTPVAPDLSVDDPASQPFVVGAGGTSMLTATEPPDEVVWNDGVLGGGGGGGISNTWSSPAWQASSGVSGVDNSYADDSQYDFCGATRTEAYVPLCREVPDVTLDADEYRGPSVFMASEGDWTTFGGTSSSAPMWAAITADITRSSSCSDLPTADRNDQPDLGFVSPGLYEVAANPTEDAQSFNDIRKGSNDIYDLGKGYPATKGYDLTSGLGSPIVAGPSGQAGLAANLCRTLGGGAAPATPEASGVTVSHISPDNGTASGGTSVTVTGSGFSAGSATVDFGGKPATSVSVASDTSLTAVAPSAPTPPGTIGQASGPVDVTVTVVGNTTATSAPSPEAVYDYVPVSSDTTTPAVRGVGPYGGPTAGGNDVRVYGAGFESDGPLTVTFGGVAATNVKVLTNQVLTATVPPSGGETACTTGIGFVPDNDCQVQVVVSASGHGSSPTTRILPAYTGSAMEGGNGILQPTPGTEVTPAPTEYDYAPRPVIRSISPNPADPSGTSPIAISGSGFNILTFDWVNFGPAGIYFNEDSVLGSISRRQIVLDPPPGPRPGPKPAPLAGGVDVVSLGGTSAAHSFSYAGKATVTGVSPDAAPDTGGRRITLTGTGLEDVTVIQFKGSSPTSAFDFISRSASSITFVAPANLPSVDVAEPCTAAGCARPKGATDRHADTFVFYDVGPPSVSGLRPASGPAAGGNEVIIFGNNLDGATAVDFGRSAGRDITSALPEGYPDGSPYAIEVKAPAGTAGSTVQVTVVTRSGTTATSSRSAYTYQAAT